MDAHSLERILRFLLSYVNNVFQSVLRKATSFGCLRPGAGLINRFFWLFSALFLSCSPPAMIFLTLIIVIGLVFWALRLMDRAVANQEFSLMLAGFLVASSAAAMVGVYFLMSDYFMFVNQANGAFDSYDTLMIEGELPNWFESADLPISAEPVSADISTDKNQHS